MKNRYLCGLILLLIMMGCKNAGPGSNEIPITTSNDEALQLFLEGRELLEYSKVPQAAPFFEKAIELDSQFAMAYLYRGFTVGDYVAYLENLSIAVELVDNLSQGEKHLMLYYEAAADYEGIKQKSELDALLNLFPEDKRIQMLAGNYYRFTVQDYEKALEHYNNAIDLDLNYASAYNSVGYLQNTMNNYTEAEKAFKNYISLIPDEANPYDSYAEFLFNQGRFQESIEQYQNALEADPEFLMALNGIGENYDFMKEHEKARNTFQQVYDQAQNNNQMYGALFSIAESFMFEGNISKAIETLEKRADLGMEKDQRYVVINSKLWIKNILEESARFDEAQKYYEEIEKFIESSDFKETDRETGGLYIGLYKCKSNILKGELDKAEAGLSEFESIVEQRNNPEEIQELNLTKGMYEAGKKNYKAALEYYKLADKENPYVWYYEGEAYEKDGNIEEARKCYQKVVDCNAHRIDLAIILDRAKNKLS